MSDFFTLPVLAAIVITIFAFILLLEPESLSQNSIEEKKLHYQFRSSKHKWEKSQLKSFYFCYLCHKLISSWFSSDVLECKKCGIVIHRICKYLKFRKPQCKYIIAKPTSKQDSTFYHQWRQCSYHTETTCSVCESLCVGVETYLCIWCQRVKHGTCDGSKYPCNFGKLRKFILEPTEISCPNSAHFTTQAFTSLRKRNRRIKQKTSDDSENSQGNNEQIQFKIKDQNKRPVIIVINKKSGGQTGSDFIKAFYQALNPLQVISILDEGLQKLKLFVKLPGVFFVVAGGDGTICSVLNYLKTIPECQKTNPPVAILPLGTGNDLSRSLGWGYSADEVNPQTLIPDFHRKGKPELLDRWTMKIEHGEQTKELTLYNYLGIGLDARICKQFHETREKYPNLFFSQFSNKLIYTQMGAVDMFKASNRPLKQLIDVKVDGKTISLEDIENVILLNIKHWGGGVTNLWEQNKSFKRQSYCDGLLEVIGLSDVVHMGQVQVGMDAPFQLGQGQLIEITSLDEKSKIPIQIDGEPLELMGKVSIRVQRRDQVNVLATNPNEESYVLGVLMQGMKQKIIDEEQFNTLVHLSNKLIKQI